MLLLDNSAWARIGASNALSPSRAEEIAQYFAQRRIAVCLPFLLEAGYSARGARDHATLLDRFDALPRFEIDVQSEERALSAQQQLARIGHHRIPPVDLIVAAVADRHGVGVLHYDSDYDLIAHRTDLRFESVWLAPRASLE